MSLDVMAVHGANNCYNYHVLHHHFSLRSTRNMNYFFTNNKLSIFSKSKRGNSFKVYSVKEPHKPKKEKALKMAAAEKERERCRDLNFGAVLTHCTADFDSLAAAVGLARWRDHQESSPGCTAVVMPQGANPTVQHFLALHKNFYPIQPRRNIEPQNLNFLAVVDGQRRDRFGSCAEWLDVCPKVEIYDHHVDQTSDIAGKQIIQPVGSVTTLIVEMLMKDDVKVSDKDATLLALGIHSDTGSLVYECTTERDVQALAYCLRMGASQKAIMQFSRVQLAVEQRVALNEGLLRLEVREFQRVRLGCAHVKVKEYLPGAATVARELMEVSNLDVLVLAVSYLHAGKKKASVPGAGYQHVSLIGRACVELEGVNLSSVLQGLNGGGHPKAAATTFRMDKLHLMPDEEFNRCESVEELLSGVVERVCQTQIPPVKVAAEVMTEYKHLVVADPTFTVDQALEVIRRYEFRTLPVVGPNGELFGLVSLADLEREQMNGLGGRPITSSMQRELYLANPIASVPDIEDLFVDKAVGSLPIVQGDPGQKFILGDRYPLKNTPRLLGFITRTDVLREHAFYKNVGHGSSDVSFSFFSS